jgi:hypothetical protein
MKTLKIIMVTLISILLLFFFIKFLVQKYLNRNDIPIEISITDSSNLEIDDSIYQIDDFDKNEADSVNIKIGKNVKLFGRKIK